MITYELALKLKEVGFPRPEEGQFWVKGGKTVIYAYEEHDKEKLGLSYCPTLSELIEACGKMFFVLTRFWESDTWFANNYFGENPGCYADPKTEELICPGINGIGKTPEEAVAKLWLKLNEHKTKRKA